MFYGDAFTFYPEDKHGYPWHLWVWIEVGPTFLFCLAFYEIPL